MSAQQALNTDPDRLATWRPGCGYVLSAQGIRFERDPSDDAAPSDDDTESQSGGFRRLGRLVARLFDRGNGRLPRQVAWSEIAEAAIAHHRMRSPDKTDPDAFNGSEWLLLAHRDGPLGLVIWPIPAGPERDALVEALSRHLGERFVNKPVPLADVGHRFGVGALPGNRPRRREPRWLVGRSLLFKVLFYALVAPVAILVALPIYVVAVGALPILSAVVIALTNYFGGLFGIRDAIAMKNTPVSSIASAALGRVRLEGRLMCEHPSAAAVSGLPSLWWEVRIESTVGDRETIAEMRSAALSNLLYIRDDTGTLPVWRDDTEPLLRETLWRSGRDTLPERGQALIAKRDLTWTRSAKLRIVERRLPYDAPVHVLGTLDEAGALLASSGKGRQLPLAPSDLVVRPGSEDSILMISDHDVRRDANALVWRAIRKVALGAAAVVLGLFGLWAQYFGK